ncbi:MAG: terpene synthase family protein, partial [Gammaproteobacteria bacterium]
MSIEDITVPTLYCPFPSAVNPHREAVHEHTLAWARRFGLVKDEAAIARLRDSKFASLVARTYPRASRDPLGILADWFTWVFMLDDECDEAEIGKRPERLAALQARCLEALSGKGPENLRTLSRPRPDRPDVDLIYALYDLRGRIEAFMSRAWMDRFAVSIAEYFEASVWEARNRELGVWPDAATYSRMRPFAGGMYIVLDFIDLTESDILPLVVRKHPYFQRLMLITSNVVLWCNDLFSCAKELAHQDMHNFALILQHQEDIPLQAAVDRVARLIEREVKRFIALESRLPSFGPTIDGVVQRFIAGLRHWMRGNLDWSYESGRYRPTSASPPMGVPEHRAAGYGV